MNLFILINLSVCYSEIDYLLYSILQGINTDITINDICFNVELYDKYKEEGRCEKQENILSDITNEQIKTAESLLKILVSSARINIDQFITNLLEKDAVSGHEKEYFARYKRLIGVFCKMYCNKDIDWDKLNKESILSSVENIEGYIRKHIIEIRSLRDYKLRKRLLLDVKGYVISNQDREWIKRIKAKLLNIIKDNKMPVKEVEANICRMINNINNEIDRIVLYSTYQYMLFNFQGEVLINKLVDIYLHIALFYRNSRETNKQIMSQKRDFYNQKLISYCECLQPGMSNILNSRAFYFFDNMSREKYYNKGNYQKDKNYLLFYGFMCPFNELSDLIYDTDHLVCNGQCWSMRMAITNLVRISILINMLIVINQ